MVAFHVTRCSGASCERANNIHRGILDESLQELLFRKCFYSLTWDPCLSKNMTVNFHNKMWYIRTDSQGSFPVRRRTGTLRIWRARERESIWGSGGGAPNGVQGQSPWSGGRSPPEAEGILLPKRANLSLSFKWNLNFAAFRWSKKEQELCSGSKRTLEYVHKPTLQGRWRNSKVVGYGWITVFPATQFHTFIHIWNKVSHFTPQPQSITALWLVLPGWPCFLDSPM